MDGGRFVNAGGVRTYYIERGTGPTVVLFHGAAVGNTSLTTWSRQIDALSSTHRVIAFDQIGFGQTDMPSDRRYRNRLERVDHALAFLQAINLERAILIGHSQGAFMATRIAITHPDLVDRLVISASGGTTPRFGDDRDDAWIAASKASYSYDTVPTEEEFVKRKLPARHVTAETERYVREAYHQAITSGQFEMFRNLPKEETDFAQLFTKLQEEYIFPFLSSLKMSTLILCAKDDATVPMERAVLLANMIPHADFYVFSGAGHALMADRADDVNAILTWWCSE